MRAGFGARLGPTVATAMARPHNNFTALRLALALAVIVSHAFSVTTGTLHNEPLMASTGFTLGEHAVNGFFAVSGFLVTMSFDRRGWRDYLVARTLRIAPALVAATLVTALILGAALTRLPLGQYFSEPGVWRFIALTPTTFKSATSLPGVFADNVFPYPMGTVWTLKYELFCYVGVFLGGIVGLLRYRLAALALAAALFLSVAGLDLFHPEAGKAVQTTFRLTFLFAAGGALYLWGDRVPVSWAVALALLAAAWLAGGTALYKALLFAFEAYAVIFLGLAPGLSHPRLDLDADLSYGTYLYGWPVQQALVQLFPGAAALALLPPAVAISLIVAALSWFLVEKPALALKARLVRAPAPAASPQPAE
ncbi:MAG TPA: acyltransferase [Beijerinckiaceae bacterium]|jgi:peptidoglycan/LPS O-acetylase OafA/YrhL